MPLTAISLEISTPSDALPSGRGFYQLEEDSLYVEIGRAEPNARYFSHLEGNVIRLDIDKQGRLLFIEVNLARRHWPVGGDMEIPAVSSLADIRWLDFRETVTDPELITNNERSWLQIRFAADNGGPWYRLADHVLLQTDGQRRLAALWVTSIVDDLAGQEIAAFRRQQRLLADRQRRTSAEGPRG
jgi:hypothetical protein